MEHIGAGLAALGVIGPGIGVGILAGMAANAIGRNPDAAGQIRGLAIILAAFAEGLGVLAIVVGLRHRDRSSIGATSAQAASPLAPRAGWPVVPRHSPQ